MISIKLTVITIISNSAFKLCILCIFVDTSVFIRVNFIARDRSVIVFISLNTLEPVTFDGNRYLHARPPRVRKCVLCVHDS